MSETSRARKPRRTKVQLEDDLLNGLMRLVEKEGFTNIPLYKITKEADIDSNVFYRRYDSVNELYALLVKRYDCWLGGIACEDKLEELGSRQFLIDLLKRLFIELSENKVMQKLLIWELTENNEVTQHTTAIRERYNQQIVDHYISISSGKFVDLRNAVTFMVTAIYYIVLHREHAENSIMSFKPYNNNQEVFDIITTFVNLLFDKLEHEENLRERVKVMLADGISPDKIAIYLGVTKSEYDTLISTL